jgi:hypothetical protein
VAIDLIYWDDRGQVVKKTISLPNTQESDRIDERKVYQPPSILHERSRLEALTERALTAEHAGRLGENQPSAEAEQDGTS